jgi:signal transduction histidine kinase
MRLEKFKLVFPALAVPDRKRTVPPAWVVRYGFAAVCVLGAFTIRYALAPVLGADLALAIFVPAALIASCYGGTGPGLFALVSGLVVGAWFFLPSAAFRPLDAKGWIAAGTYAGTAVIGLAIMEALHRVKRRADAMQHRIDAQGQTEAARARLAEHTRELEARVAERTAKLEETVQSLEGVLYHVAHDLRAPLRAMEGFAQILLDTQAPQLTPVGKDYASRIVTSANRMDRLIQDLLAYGHLAHKEVPCRSINLEAEVARVLAHLDGEIKLRHAQIEVRRPLQPVRANAAVLDQILTNLLTNALKFVQFNAPPRVVLGASNHQARVRLWIQDNGIGIEESHREQIFHVFGRLHPADAYPGTGIGLALVRKGAERMGGAAGVDSTPGRGSCFWVELPAGQAATAPADR